MYAMDKERSLESDYEHMLRPSDFTSGHAPHRNSDAFAKHTDRMPQGSRALKALNVKLLQCPSSDTLPRSRHAAVEAHGPRRPQPGDKLHIHGVWRGHTVGRHMTRHQERPC